MPHAHQESVHTLDRHEPEPASGERYLALSEQGRASLRKALSDAESDTAQPLTISSILSLSSSDFPGRLAAVVYCSDGHARAARGHYSWQAVEYFLSRWSQTLSGVVFAGCEPTLQPGLAEAAARCQELGFAVGVHTRGADPKRLREALIATDWVSLHVPLAPSAWTDDLSRSLDLMLASRVGFECRIEADGGESDLDTVARLARQLSEKGVKEIYLSIRGALGRKALLACVAELEARFARVRVKEVA